MGCARCGQKNVQYKYEYTDPSGKKTTYNSEIQARAAQIRNKGGSIKQVRA